MTTRSRTSTAEIDFSTTDRKTKRLIELKDLSYSIGERPLFRKLNFLITSGKRVGLVGPNGSGKTTLLRLLRGELAPASGEIRRADFLRVVYFDQNRPLDPDITLRRALAPESDSVVYQDRVTHVASWAQRFLFTNEQLNQPVGRLSGGERARVLIAQLMLQPADVLLLDEPTNDLDIPTLELLEESLLEFNGALVLVTHDRYMLDRVSTVVLGLSGDANAQAESFADYAQWEAWMEDLNSSAKSADTTGWSRPSGLRQGTPNFSSGLQPLRAPVAATKKKLSYLEAREYSTIEQRIAEAEEVLAQKKAAAEDPVIASDAARLLSAHAELEAAQNKVDELYARWSELEAKMS
jgi:ABC transport system ATP-binding/permease protein